MVLMIEMSLLPLLAMSFWIMLRLRAATLPALIPVRVRRDRNDRTPPNR